MLLKPTRTKKRIQTIAYLIVIVAIGLFLISQGKAPWISALESWKSILVLVLPTGASVVVQAYAFRAVSVQASAPGGIQTVGIWALSAVISVVAPLFAGIATRTALLIRAGMMFRDCADASIRQIWLGLEYALLLGAISLPLTGWSLAMEGGLVALVGWLLLLLVRLGSARIDVEASVSPFSFMAWLSLLLRPVAAVSHIFFVLQVVTMAATYYIGFNALGASFGVAEAFGLASITVVVSLILFVPNGLGALDLLWVYIGTKSGLSLSDAVSVAIIIRSAHLMAAFLLIVTTQIRSWVLRRT